MSQTYVPSTPLDSLRRTWRRWWDNPDTRSVAIGLLGMLLVHVVLFLFAPHMLHNDPSATVMRPHSSAREFNIEIAPDTFVQRQKEAPPPLNFVEANPNAPDNVPDRTNNFAAQNQQVAQEKPTPDGTSDRPAIEGRTDVDSTAIVSGRLTSPTELMQAAPPMPTSPEAAAKEAAQRREIPLPGFEKTEGDNATAFGSNIAKFAEGAKAVPKFVDGVEDAPLIQGATSTQTQIDPKRPRPRPQVVQQQQVRPAIFQENKFGTRNIGAIAYDAKWSNYGQYLQKMIETVQIQWERILIESRVSPVPGTSVRVVFKLNDLGAIASIVSVEGTAGNQAEKVCAVAITERAPYGEWTDDMKAVLGAEQELTFTFFYQ